MVTISSRVTEKAIIDDSDKNKDIDFDVILNEIQDNLIRDTKIEWQRDKNLSKFYNDIRDKTKSTSYIISSILKTF